MALTLLTSYGVIIKGSRGKIKTKSGIAAENHAVILPNFPSGQDWKSVRIPCGECPAPAPPERWGRRGTHIRIFLKNNGIKGIRTGKYQE